MHDEQCNQLFACDSKELASWKAIAEGPRVQGNGLVTMARRSSWSVALQLRSTIGRTSPTGLAKQGQAWDLEHHRWQDLPSLPEPRSSMDAVVVDHHLYVLGGWTLSGDSKNARWLDTAWKLDLNHTETGWQAIASPTFATQSDRLGGRWKTSSCYRRNDIARWTDDGGLSICHR
ncbi:MAG: hypothetical protein U0905_18100 [Pirellulales bacterium]